MNFISQRLGISGSYILMLCTLYHVNWMKIGKISDFSEFQKGEDSAMDVNILSRLERSQKRRISKMPNFSHVVDSSVNSQLTKL